MRESGQDFSKISYQIAEYLIANSDAGKWCGRASILLMSDLVSSVLYRRGC